MESIHQFNIPTQFKDLNDNKQLYKLQTKNQVAGKTYQYINKNLNYISQSLTYSHELLAESADRFEFLFYLISAEDKQIKESQELQNLLTETLTAQMSKAASSQITLLSDKLILFLSLFHLSNIVQKGPTEYFASKLLKQVGKYLFKDEKGLFKTEQNIFNLICSACLNVLHIQQSHFVLAVALRSMFEQDLTVQKKVTISRLAGWGTESEQKAVSLAHFISKSSTKHVLNEDNDERRYEDVMNSIDQKELRDFLTQVVQMFMIYSKSNKHLSQNKSNRAFIEQLIKTNANWFTDDNLLHHLLSFLDEQNYYNRNTTLQGLVELMKGKVFTEIIEKQVIRLILNRVTDGNAHSRTCAVNCIRVMIEESIMVKPAHLQEALTISIERLKDKSPFVRRASIKLLQQIIEFYHLNYKDSQDEFPPLSTIKGQLDSVNQERKSFSSKLEQLDLKMEMESMAQDLANVKDKLNYCKLNEQNLRRYVDFYEELEGCIEPLKMILGSRTNYEVIEAVKVFEFLMKAKYRNMSGHIKSILILGISKEQGVKECVIQVFQNIFFSSFEITRLVQDCDIVEMLSLESIMNEITEKDLIPQQTMEKLLQEIWAMWKNKQNQDERLACLKVIRLMKQAKYKKLPEKILQLDHYLSEPQVNLEQLREIILILSQNLQTIKNKPAYSKVMLIHRKSLLILSKNQTDDMGWYQACDDFIRTVLETYEDPESAIQQFLDQLLQSQENETCLAHLLFAFSTSCLKLLVYTDRIRDQINTIFSFVPKRKEQFKIKTRRQKDTNEEDDELIRITGENEKASDEKHQQLDFIIENFLDESSKVSYIFNASKRICQSILDEQAAGGQTRDQVLDQVAVLSFQLMLCISKVKAQENIDIIFQLLDSSSVSARIRCNILITLADNYYRHPKEIENHMEKFLKCLNSQNLCVRRTALLVITHLMLMDLFKSKSEISKICRLINDPDDKMRLQTKIFFQELNKKDHYALYAILPDIITQMAQDKAVLESEFQTFAQELVPLIEKDKVTEQLIEKFLERFQLYTQEAEQKRKMLQQREQKGDEDFFFYNPLMLSGERECKFLAICLQYFSYNLQNLKKLVQGYEYYREFLKKEFIYQAFRSVYSKCKKVSIFAKGKKSENQQEFNRLLKQFDENLSKHDEQYHIQQVNHQQQKTKTKSKKMRSKKPLHQMISIDYSLTHKPQKIQKPTIAKSQKQIPTKQIVQIENIDVEQQSSEEIDLNSSDSSVEIEI